MSKKRNYINKFDSFSNLTNKFNFIIGRKYIFDELPDEIKDDIQIQFDEYSDLQPEDYCYVAKLLKPEEIEEYLHNHFGEYDIQDALEESYMKELIKDIQNKGLDYPVVGVEGNHRALAFWFLKKDLPYLEMFEID